MTRTQVIDLFQKSAAAAVNSGAEFTAAESTALQLLRWTPNNVKEQGEAFAAGFLVGAFRMSAHASPKLRDEISQAMFVMEEIMRYDGLIPVKQVRDAARKLAGIGERKAA